MVLRLPVIYRPYTLFPSTSLFRSFKIPGRVLCQTEARSVSATDGSRIVNRLRRIEGQVRGVAQMIEDDRYCIDVLNQVQAIKAALGRAESEILKRHAA